MNLLNIFFIKACRTLKMHSSIQEILRMLMCQVLTHLINVLIWKILFVLAVQKTAQLTLLPSTHSYELSSLGMLTNVTDDSVDADNEMIL